MNIVLIGPYYPFRGGISDTNQELCQSLIKSGHNVEVINFKLLYPKILFPGKSQFDYNNGVDLKSKKILNSINPINWFFVAKKINSLHPDLIISTYWTGFLSPCLYAVNKLTKNIKKIGVIHNSISHENKFFEKKLLKIYLSSLTNIFTLSKNVLNQIKNISSSYNARSLYHPLPEKFGNKINKDEAKRRLKLKVKNRYILFFGLIREYKGVELLIRSIPKILEKNNDVKLMIVGENYISLKKYKILIDKLGISKNIIFKNEYVKNNDVKYWFSASELVILPYKTASQSGIIPLSIKFETPVVCSNINGLKEDVIDNQTGFLFERSVENLSNKINYALNTNKKKIISNIIKHKKNLSWDNFNKELLKNRHE